MPAGQLGSFQNPIGGIAAHAGEGAGEELPEAAGIALGGHLRERLQRHLRRRGAAAVGKRRFDHKRVPPVDRRRSGGGGEKLSRHHLSQARQEPLLADRHDAVGGRRRDFCVLDRFEESIGLAPPQLGAGGSRGELGRFAKLAGNAGGNARKGGGEELRERELGMLLQERDEPAEFHAIGMRLDLLGLGGQVVRGTLKDPFRAVGPLEMKPGMRIGDRRLLQIFLDAAAAALELCLHLDRDPRAMVDRIIAVVGRHPFDGVLGHQIGPHLAGRQIDPLALAVEDLGFVGFGVDPQFVVVGRFLGRGLRDDLHRLAGGEHPIHAGRRDADPLLAAAHAQAMEF